MRTILLRFGELYLKGNNRNIFESILIENIKKKLEGETFKFSKTFGRYVISDYDEQRESEIVSKLLKVFGLHSLSLAEEVDADYKSIEDAVKKINLGKKTFKVVVKRADKTFPMTSMELASTLGGVVLKANKEASVDVYNPEVEINVDIRLNKKAYIFSSSISLYCSNKALRPPSP